MRNIDNADKLIKKFESMANNQFVDKALEYVGVFIEGWAKEKCPSDTNYLRQMIQHEVKDGTLTVGTNVEYAPYVEIGTGLWAGTSSYSSEYAGTGRQTPWHYQDNEGNWHTTIGQQPQPFLKPAVDDNYKQINDLFAQKYKEELSKL